MSKNSDFELDLDLQLLPEWARQAPTVNRYAKYEGDEGGDPRRGRGGPGFRRGPRPDRDRGRPPRREGGPPRGDRPDRGGPRPGGGGPREDRGPAGGRRFDRRPPGEEIPLPELLVNLVPEEAGVESLAHQIKLTGRAYPLFDIAALILQRRERYHIEIGTKRDAEGKVAQPLFLCSLDNSVWFTEEEVAAHVLAKHLDTLYQTDRVPTEPPKGTYTLVAQCPVSGVILGPPNLHDYNQKLRKLHADRFSRMPFEAYKARIKMVTDEAVVKQWVEEQSFRNEYTCLNVPEPLKFATREEVEQHFRETHLPGLARSTDKHTFPGAGDWPAMPRGLKALINRTTDEQRRFPLRVATVLSQQFARHGLQFFKVNKTITHVCVARPHYLDLENTVVSDGVLSIVKYIRAHEGCTRRELLEVLAPTPPATEEPAPTSPTGPTSPTSPTGPMADQGGAAAPAAAEAPAPAPSETAPASTPAPAAPQPTREQATVIADLHWLIHQGHVIEFTSGRMELAKRPQPKPAPAKPKQKDKPKPAAAPAASVAAPTPTAPPPAPAPPAVAAAESTPVPTPGEPAESPAGEPAATEPSAEPAVSTPAAPAPPAEPAAPAAQDLSASTTDAMGSTPAVTQEPTEGMEATESAKDDDQEKPPQPPGAAA